MIDDDQFPGRQGRLLFAYLVAEEGRPVPRDELADALWGETPGDMGQGALPAPRFRARARRRSGGGVLSVNASRDFFSARIGCQLYQPLLGLDLAALCVRHASSAR